MIATLVLITLSLSSCKSLNSDLTYNQMLQGVSPEALSLLEDPEYQNCKIWTKELFADVILKCNLWGISKLDGRSAKLCTMKDKNFFGWQWELPTNRGGVIGYPALQVGIHPMDRNSEARLFGFPVQVAEISKLTVNYEVEQYVKHKKYNLAFDLWLTDKEFGRKGDISTEIMIWEDYFDFSSYGKVIDRISTPFGEYKVHVGYLKNEKAKQDWKYIAFVRINPREEGEIDINYLLQYLVEEEVIEADHYFTSIEFGNEIGNSSGLTLVKKFDWALERKTPIKEEQKNKIDLTKINAGD